MPHRAKVTRRNHCLIDHRRIVDRLQTFGPDLSEYWRNDLLDERSDGSQRFTMVFPAWPVAAPTCCDSTGSRTSPVTGVRGNVAIPRRGEHQPICASGQRDHLLRPAPRCFDHLRFVSILGGSGERDSEGLMAQRHLSRSGTPTAASRGLSGSSLRVAQLHAVSPEESIRHAVAVGVRSVAMGEIDFILRLALPLNRERNRTLACWRGSVNTGSRMDMFHVKHRKTAPL